MTDVEVCEIKEGIIMKLLRWIAAFFLLLTVAFCCMIAVEGKKFNLPAYTNLTAEQILQNAPETAEKIGIYTLAAFGCCAMAALVIMAMVVIHLRDERALYKLEQKLYGRDISGYKAVHGFKLTAAFLLLIGFVLIVFGGYKVGKYVTAVPIANKDLSTRMITNVYYYEDGTPYYTFKTPSGAEFSNTIDGGGKFFITPKKEITIRYLNSDPSQNSIDFPSFYMPEQRTFVNMFYGGLVCVLLAVFLLVVALALGRYNVAANRKRGYVRRFDNINDSSRLFENYDEDINNDNNRS